MTLTPLKLLLVDETADRRVGLVEALRRAGYEVLGVVSTVQDLDAQVRALSPDVVLIEADSPDRDTLEQLSVAMAGAPRPVVLGASSGDPEFIRAAVRAGVSAYVVDGIEHARLEPILTEAVARFEALQALREERDAARAAIGERKLIERAKGIIMRTRRCDEEAAYRVLRRLSQERALGLPELARQILVAAGHLGPDPVQF
jgi:response regulator NasT